MFCHFVMLYGPLSFPRSSQFLDHFSGDNIVLLMSFSTEHNIFVNFFQIWSMLHVAGYEELAVGFKPIKSGEYFE